MGAAFSSWLKKLFGKNEVRIVMVGLDDAGKSSILSKIQGNSNTQPLPTIGYNLEEVVIQKTTFVVWDVGGQEKIRVLWPHYYKDCKGMIFVVDSQNVSRISCGREAGMCNQCASCELHKLMSSAELRESTFLIFANKQDLPGALNVEQIRDALGLSAFLSDPHRRTRIQPCSALSGDGLMAGFTWLATNLPKGAK